MSSFIIKEGNGTETSTVTNGETITFSQGAGIETELVSTSSGGTLRISNTITNNNQLTNGAGYTTNTGTTTASNSQTFTNKGGNISQWTNNSGYITSASLPTVNNGTLTMTTSTGLDGGTTFTANQSGNSTFAVTLDLSELTDMTAAMTGSDEFIVLDSGAERRKAASEIGLSIFSNDAGFTTNVGDITGVTAGTGMSGGGTSGTVTLNCTITNNNQLTNGSNYITASSSNTLTNKGGNISQWTNDSGYITSSSIPSVGNGQIDGRTSGNGLSGSMDATANQSGNTTFTVTSNATTAATASTIAYRDSAGDTTSRLFRSEYGNESTISGGMVFRVNNTTDNYMRTCSSPSAIRTFIGAASSSVVSGVTSVATGNGISGGTITSTGTLTVGAGDGLSQSSTGLLVDSTVVRTSGAQTIADTKTFTTTPISVTRSTADNSTYLATTAFVKNQGYTTNVGDITGVTAGTGMSGGGTSGTVTLNCTITNNNQLTNGAGYTTNVGDITGVTAGDGLSGGGSSGSVSVAVDSTVVRTSGNQSISGTKSFNSTTNINDDLDMTGGNNILLSDAGMISIDDDFGSSGQVLTTRGSYMEWATPSSGGITGSGVSGRIPVFNGTSSVTSDSAFAFNTSTNVFTAAKIAYTPVQISVGYNNNPFANSPGSSIKLLNLSGGQNPTSNVSSPQAGAYYVAPQAGRIKQIVLRNVAGSPTSYSTRIKIYKNGSNTYTSSYSSGTNANSIGWYVDFDDINHGFSQYDRIQVAFQGSNSNTDWEKFNLSMVIQYENYEY